jgi:hypothetical protein
MPEDRAPLTFSTNSPLATLVGVLAKLHFCPPRSPTLFPARIGVHYLIASAKLEAYLGLNVDLYFLWNLTLP